MTLVEFLLACITEDEETVTLVEFTATGHQALDNFAAFVDSQRKAQRRTMAECAAKRKIVDLAFEYAALIDSEWGCGHSVEQIREGKCARYVLSHDDLLRTLAEPYADHPDYREEWRP